MEFYLAHNLRFLRLQKNKSQTAIANKLGLKRITYAKYEDGKNEPKIITLLSISRFCKLSIEELLTKKIKKSDGRVRKNN